jgi:hypothetical protein
MTNETSHTAPDILVEVVEGPNGNAEIHEIQESLTSIVYEVRFGGESERYDSIGEAYIEAGEKAGKHV